MDVFGLDSVCIMDLLLVGLDLIFLPLAIMLFIMLLNTITLYNFKIIK